MCAMLSSRLARGNNFTSFFAISDRANRPLVGVGGGGGGGVGGETRSPLSVFSGSANAYRLNLRLLIL